MLSWKLIVAARQCVTVVDYRAAVGTGREAATVAYLEANSAVHYLIDRFGMSRVHALLAQLKGRQALSAAMLSQLSLSYEQFQARWMDQLHEHERKISLSAVQHPPIGQTFR